MRQTLTRFQMDINTTIRVYLCANIRSSYVGLSWLANLAKLQWPGHWHCVGPGSESGCKLERLGAAELLAVVQQNPGSSRAAEPASETERYPAWQRRARGWAVTDSERRHVVVGVGTGSG